MRFTQSLVFVIAGLTMSACAATAEDATSDDEAATSSEIQVKPQLAWQFDIGVNEGGNAHATVSHDGVVEPPPCFDTACHYAFVDGTVVHISVQSQDLPNCQIFSKWTGACAGQGTSCTITIHSNLTTEAIYVRKLGCTPV